MSISQEMRRNAFAGKKAASKRRREGAQVDAVLAAARAVAEARATGLAPLLNLAVDNLCATVAELRKVRP